MASESLDQMVVSFLADYESLTNAPSVIGATFSQVASRAEEASSQISESLNVASESFGEISQAATESGSQSGASMADLIATINDAADSIVSAINRMQTGFVDVENSVLDASHGMMSSIDTLSSQVLDSSDEIVSSLDKIGSNATTAGERTRGAFSGFSLSGMTDGLVSAVFKFQMLGQTAMQLGGSLLQPAMDAENVTTALTTLDGSAAKAAKEMANLNSFAAKTPFKTLDIDTAAEQLQGFGYKAGQVIPMIKSIGDALGSVGKETPAELMSVVDIFGKMKSEGKVTAQQMTELGVHGINAWKALSDGSGKSIKDLKEMVAKGLLPANEAVGWLTKGIEKNPLYAGGMAKQSNTLAGIVSTLSSDWDQFMASIISPALPMLEKGLGKLTDLLSSPSFQKFAGEVGKDIVSALTHFAQTIGNLISTGQHLVSFFQHNQTAMDALVAILISAAGVILGVLIPAFVGWALAMLPVVAETLLVAAPFILIGLIVAAVVFGIIEAIQHWGAITKWLSGVWNAIVGFFSGILNAIVGFFKNNWKTILEILLGPIGLIIHFWTPITHFFQNLGNGIVQVFKNIGQGIWGGIKWAINGVIGLINDAIGGIDSIGIDIGPVHIHPNIPKIPLLAAGGYVAPGGMAIAGEAGPEVVFGGRGGASVMSAAASRAMLAGQQPIHIHNHIYLDGREITSSVMTRTIDQMRSGHPLGEVA